MAFEAGAPRGPCRGSLRRFPTLQSAGQPPPHFSEHSAPRFNEPRPNSFYLGPRTALLGLHCLQAIGRGFSGGTSNFAPTPAENGTWGL